METDTPDVRAGEPAAPDRRAWLVTIAGMTRVREQHQRHREPCNYSQKFHYGRLPIEEQLWQHAPRKQIEQESYQGNA